MVRLRALERKKLSGKHQQQDIGTPHRSGETNIRTMNGLADADGLINERRVGNRHAKWWPNDVVPHDGLIALVRNFVYAPFSLRAAFPVIHALATSLQWKIVRIVMNHHGEEYLARWHLKHLKSGRNAITYRWVLRTISRLARFFSDPTTPTGLEKHYCTLCKVHHGQTEQSRNFPPLLHQC